ncbi:NAD(P)-dependent dehydrogenase (short-subunit alcohol dehydrogenase family) [Microterricola gilva]|uniref:NAD(P)-dependent dehydrogenase (Short-subunit alcohol dehydrogenase family) n=1 Tax=Microterricola gilva TaxID=393267 RepID=A0A4Q8AKR1_9MICO|nr:SDR family oxidoreductase [Microterricola gilva]RZU65122.1 NAD(P)-dependent dehydrogenase (short-subunit alcohol dehydrogenase family) [Microterricola gilva]
MDLTLSGRVAVVTGASRGIGVAVTRSLLREGCTVIGIARGPRPEDDDLRDQDGYTYIRADLSRSDAIEALADALPGRIDVLVNNVGSAPPRPGGFGSITDEDWTGTLSLNLLAAVRMTRMALPRIPSGGAIVNVASENSKLPDPLVMDYSVAKAGLLSFTKSLSKELGPTGVRVNSISPGPVATDLWLGSGGVAEQLAAATGGNPEQVRAGAEQAMPTGRFTRPEEVADLIAVLASPRFGNVTGSDFVIDGGMRPTM